MTRDPGQRLHHQDVLGGYPPPHGYRVVLQADLGGDLGGASSGADDISDMHTETFNGRDFTVKTSDPGPNHRQDPDDGAWKAAETIGGRLRLLRRSRKLRQWQVAGETGLSRNFISGIETDSACYSRETLKSLAAFYQVSLDELELVGASVPKYAKIVECPIQIQLLDFWESLSPEKQEFFVDLLKSASKAASQLR